MYGFSRTFVAKFRKFNWFGFYYYFHISVSIQIYYYYSIIHVTYYYIGEKLCQGKKHHIQALGFFPKISSVKHRNINKGAYDIPSEEMKDEKAAALGWLRPTPS